MTCFIPLKCLTDDDNVVQMFVAFFFNQVENKLKFPYFVGPVNMTVCGSLIQSVILFLFDVRMKNQLIPARPQNIHDLSCMV